MSKFGKDPYTLDAFWVNLAAEKLSNPLITPQYRKRLERIYFEAQAKIAKTGIVSNFYPRERK